MQIFLTFITVVLLGIDWLQTLYIAKHPLEYFEVNFILGKHPTVQRVTAYFAAWALLCVAIGLL